MSKESEDLLLAPAPPEASDYVVPVAIAAGGLAVAFSLFGKNKGSAASSSPDAGEKEVAFSSDMMKYDIGEDYEQLVLEPFLAEQAEDGILYTTGMGDEAGGLSIEETEALKASRIKVLNAYSKTHKARVGDEQRLISELNQKSSAVQNFNQWLLSTTQKFQETY